MEKRTNGVAIGKEFPSHHGYRRLPRFLFPRGIRQHACMREARQQIQAVTSDYSRGIDIATNGAAAPAQFGGTLVRRSAKTVINGKRSWQRRADV
jgi:hypothetical protein